MKKFLVFMLLSITTAGYAQFKELKYMKSVDNSVIYQRVFECKGDVKTNVIRLLKSGPFANIDTLGATLTDFVVDKKKYNKGAMLPIYMSGTWTGTVLIDIKEGKYRVTVSHLLSMSGLEVNYGAGITSTAQKESIETFVLKNDGTFRPAHENAVLVLCDALSDLFTVKETEVGDNW